MNKSIISQHQACTYTCTKLHLAMPLALSCRPISSTVLVSIDSDMLNDAAAMLVDALNHVAGMASISCATDISVVCHTELACADIQSVGALDLTYNHATIHVIQDNKYKM